MTKEQELKLLDKIAGLIAESGKDSYISMTFAGIVDVCKRNIEDDFGDSPVADLELERERFHAESRMHDETKRQLANTQKMCEEAMNECESLKSQVRNLGQDAANLAEERDAMSDCVNGLQEIMDKQEIEIRNLKAEIVHMKLDRMTYDEYADLYDKMNEED